MSQRSRKRKIENEDQTMVDSEQNNLSFDEIKNEIKTMWEVIQIIVAASVCSKIRRLISCHFFRYHKFHIFFI